MSALRLHLVRHGETLFNVRHQLQGWCDAPLTPRGLKQVEALGEHFRDVPLVAAFSSDLTRTRATTLGGLAAHPSIEPVWLRELREWNFGGWEGQSNPSLWEPLFASRGYRYGEEGHWALLTANGPEEVIDLIAASDVSGLAETAAQVTERMRAAVRIITTAVDSGDVLVVTHGSALQTLIPAFVPGARIEAGYPNCGVTTVTISDGVASLGRLDASCSLPEYVTSGFVLP
ncbi:histidine phosphatase family protein [Herbiconiux moechotypicola]|uniref:Histidine phosphatase family protein n=1 Tax=Herbiconiux moechotypicola TaxID=637393 RepID=A0ABN3DDF7_9MICO|nr:histidine phosphatase family protein [Herbiconiux moechotypicola]MCS5729162.1 histidine phosphatase family protein [Herbiconiux moechotypicola]